MLEKAKESLSAAEILSEEELYDFSASRSYYAMFYTAEALLLTKGLSFSSHQGVISWFGKEFIKTKIFPPKLREHLAQAFDLRQLGDYGMPHSIPGEQAQELIRDSREFIATIEEYLKDKGFLKVSENGNCP